MRIKMLLTICLFLPMSLIAQMDSWMPILSEPQLVIDQEGNKIFTLPKGEKIINSWEGKHDVRWREGLASFDIGTCGNIVTVNENSRTHSLFDTNGKFLYQFKKIYQSITPCNEGFHVAVSSTDKNSPYSRQYKVFHFLDTNGRIIFSKDGYNYADVFVDGLAAVRNSKYEWCYINDLGHELKLIPEEIEKVKSATSFHYGVSVVKAAIPEDKKGKTFRVYFIDREGKIIFDSHEAFNGTPVKRVSKFHNGLIALTLLKEGDIKTGFHLVYLNNQGEIVWQTENAYSNIIAKSGYILDQTQDRKNFNVNYKIFDAEGNEVIVPNIFETGTKNIYHINDQYFQVSHTSNDNQYRLTLFDAKTGQHIYDLEDYALAVKGNLISMVNKSTERFYVVDKDSKKVVYDSETQR